MHIFPKQNLILKSCSGFTTTINLFYKTNVKSAITTYKLKRDDEDKDIGLQGMKGEWDEECLLAQLSFKPGHYKPPKKNTQQQFTGWMCGEYEERHIILLS